MSKPQNVIRHEHCSAYTPDEIDADNSLDKFRFDACELADGTCGVWDVEHDIWIRRMTYGAAITTARIRAKARRSELNLMKRIHDQMPIIPMKPDELPTEKGFYVIRIGSAQTIAQVGKVLFSRRWHVRVMGGRYWHPVDKDYTFIARIHPGRIRGA